MLFLNGPRMKKQITAEELRAAIDYDKDTGIFTWRERDDVPNYWNTRFANRAAGCVTPDGRRTIRIGGCNYLEHRLAWLYVHGHWPVQIDHKNRDTLDSRIDNLREATNVQNRANQKRRKDNAAGFKGVKLVKTTGRYQARISGKHLGSYATPEEAHAAYCEAANKAFGEFARVA